MRDHNDSISGDTLGMLAGPIEPGSQTGMETTVSGRPLIDGEPVDVRRGGGLVDLSFLEPSVRVGSLGKLGDYEIVGVLGRGAMGVVLKGYDRALDRYVAVKVQDPSLAVDRRARAKFLREARAAAAINDQHVVTIFKVNAIRDRPFLVMEFLHGTLRERIKGAAPLDTADALWIAVQIARGLAAAHKMGVLHRDIKPANILLDDEARRAKISDFGLAVAGLDGEAAAPGSPDRVAGTPGYMSPEQARGEDLDARSDLFSLGCVIYAMFAGRSPFLGNTAEEVIEAVCEQEPAAPPVRPGCPIAARLSGLILRLLAKDRDCRPGSAAEAAATLEALLVAVAAAAPPPPPDPAPRLWPALVAASLALASVGCLVIGSLRLADAPAPPTWTVGRSGETHYRDLATALARAGPGTHLILTDAGAYDGPILLDEPQRLRDLTIEGRSGATLRASRGDSVVTIKGVPGVTLRGLAIETRKDQHAVTITGSAEGVVLDRLRVRSPVDSAWTQVYVHKGARGSKPRPIVISGSTFEVAHGGVTIEGDDHDAVAFVEVRGNRFGGDDEHVLVLQSAHDVAITGNVFLGRTPVTINFGAGRGRAIVVSNNSFYRPEVWIDPGDSHPDQEGILIVNNAVFEASALDGSDQKLFLMARAGWQFRNNFWEPATRVVAVASGSVTRTHPRLDVASRDPADEAFLRPLPGSSLAEGGAGGGYPKYVGAFAPAVDGARPDPR